MSVLRQTSRNREGGRAASPSACLRFVPSCGVRVFCLSFLPVEMQRAVPQGEHPY